MNPKSGGQKWTPKVAVKKLPQSWRSKVDPMSGGQKWTPKVAVKSGPQKWRLKVDPKSGGPKWTPKVAAKSGPQKWRSKKEPKSVSVLLSALEILCLLFAGLFFKPHVFVFKASAL